MIAAGIDGGSRAVKAVLVDSAPPGVAADAGARVLASGVRDQGVARGEIALGLFEELLASAAIARGDVAKVVATGHARNAIAFADVTITEITCHAAGVLELVPDAATVVEIGGQDSKVIRLDPDGTVRDFAMNDRCAAGTGCFLEMAASRLETGLDGLGELARGAGTRVAISNMCAVFAETEIIGLLASGASRGSIAAGVQASIASRVAAMVGRDVALPVVFTGGVAMVPGMAGALSEALGNEVTVPPDPQATGALGAAVLGCTRAARPRMQMDSTTRTPR